jgi:(4S)-4-hydroxy-5-phosphonooxypentane-2,3-dione isomerase
MTIKPGAAEECIRLMHAQAEESLKEPGCLQFLVHQSIENPLHFLLYEAYKDEAALAAHRASPHFARYIKGGVDALIESRTRELFLPVS